MTNIDDRLAWASEQVKAHEDARSLYGGTDHHNHPTDINNTQREEDGKWPVILEILRPNNQTGYSGEERLTPSARSHFWAKSGDGRLRETRKAGTDEIRAANEQYQERPDIESRESILRREGKI